MNKYRSLAVISALALLTTGCGSNPSSSSDVKTTTAASTAAAQTATTATKSTTNAATQPTTEDDYIPSTAVNYKKDPDTPELEGYNLLWSDEFNGATLDEEIWSREVRFPGWTNNELQEYTNSADNSFLRDGMLVLKGIKTQKDGEDYYTSGKINSMSKAQFTYGKVVARAKVPEGQGLWPAIWMMPQDEGFYGQWPKCGEIDIMEVLGSSPQKAYGTVHYGVPHSEQQGFVELTDGTFASDFHEYSVEWEPGEMRWYIDDKLYLTVNDWFSAPEGEDEWAFPAPFNQPFFVQLNLAIGGLWPGNPDETTDFSKAEFEVDYVRVYQKPEYDTNVIKPTKIFREPLSDGNYINNGNFSTNEDLTDDKDWKFMLFNGGEGSAEIKDNAIVISTKEEGTEDYSVQLVQPDMPMMKGKRYRLTFDAKADAERNIITCVSAPTVNWIRYLQDTTVKLGTEYKTYTYEFDMTEKDDNKGRLEFNLGHKASTATVYITNVRLEILA